MIILCVLGRHNYGDSARGEGYEYSNFLDALRRLGHDVRFFESWSRTEYGGFADLNGRLLRKIESIKPDLVLCVLLGYEIWLETLRLIRERCDTVVINWSTDDSWKYEQFSRFVAPAFDLYATTYPSALEKAKRDGYRNFVLTQWAANGASLTPPLRAQDCRYPVSFVGSAYGNRRRWIEQLAKRGIHVECFGHGWGHGPVPGEKVARIIRESVISLNFADSGLMFRGLIPYRSRQIKARTFEVPGAGGFLVTEAAEGIERYYAPGEEIIVFEGVENLAERIRHFLKHPEERDRIAWAGHHRTEREHTYEARFRQLLAAAVKICRGRGAGAMPARAACHIDDAEFAALERVHGAGPILRFLRQALVIPCTLIWGRRRGRRAARRFLYEASWRVLGQRTYSARGLPGRLFYRES